MGSSEDADGRDPGDALHSDLLVQVPGLSVLCPEQADRQGPGPAGIGKGKHRKEEEPE